MTSYNGKSLTYDEIGNPLTYGTYSYEWAYGRQLSKVKNGSTEVATYQYNDEGIRTVKIVNGVRHEYDVVGGQINREVIHSSSSATSAVMKDIRYYYDAAGRPVAIRVITPDSNNELGYASITYFLQTNLQGDVVGIYNDSGTKIYEYAYDAWGNIIESASAPGYTASGNAAHAVNPFRYRGYYYDTETGFYYLQSRYYNPEWGRFLNADFAEVVGNENTLTDKNLYAYCDNNPVMRSDADGEFWHVIIGAAVGAVANVAGQIINDVTMSVLTGELYYSNWQTYAGAFAGGAVGGALLALTGNAATSDFASGFVSSATSMLLENATNESQYEAGEIITSSIQSGATSLFLGKIPSVKMEGVTAGKGNYSATFKGSMTRMKKGVTHRMSAQTVGKGIWSNIVSGAYSNVAGGAVSHLLDAKKMFYF